MPKEGKVEEKPSFEAALDQLEQLVDTLESGEVPLAELVAKYSEGNKLLRQCQEHLQAAELSIQLLQKDGNLTDLEPVEKES